MINRIFGESFPYTNFHDLNLDWIIQTIKTLAEEVEKRTTAQINIADPIQWDITRQYPELTVVMDNGNAYLSMQAVPYGVDIGNSEYWEQIFNVEQLFSSFKDAITPNDDGNSTTSSADRAVGSLVWLEDTLKIVTDAISIGDEYTSGNTQTTSIEEILQGMKEDIEHASTNRLYGKKIAIYGDSYSSAPRGLLWQTILANVTGIPCHVSAQGSLSLPEVFSAMWDNYNADIYIIEAGLNDVTKNTTGNAFMTAIDSFCTAIRTVNTNAEIYFVSPPDIPFGNAHNYLYPQEFYRQCYWHTATKFHFHVIDGLKWQELKYSDGVHPTDATAPLIGKYIVEALQNFGDEWNCRNDYCKAGREDTQILLMMTNGTPYLYFQGLEFTNLLFDGTGSISISQLGCDLLRTTTAFLYKSGTTYENGFLVVEGGGISSNPNRIVVAFNGATAGESRTLGNGIEIPFRPLKWNKDLG